MTTVDTQTPEEVRAALPPKTKLFTHPRFINLQSRTALRSKLMIRVRLK